MANQTIQQTSNGRPKIWVNACSFGFGPASIVFNLFQHLRKLVTSDGGQAPLLEYVGSGLALDFNASLPWDSVHNVDVHSDGGRDRLADLYRLHLPALTITVIDISMAETLLPLGAKVVIIDVLLWYWVSVWDIYKEATLILAPDLVGVRERIKETGLTNTVVLPAMMTTTPIEGFDVDHKRKGTLVNLGGLQTPFTALSENIKFAKCIFQAVQTAVQERNNKADEPLIALVSDKVRREVLDEFPFVKTVDPYEARRLLRASRTAFMTSGLANLFDTVDYGSKVAFLPAICKSHGLQLELLRRIGARPHVVDWEHVIEGRARIDYAASDPSCSEEVQKAQAEFLASPEPQRRLVEQFVAVLESDEENTSSLRCIPDALGRADQDAYVRAIADADLGFGVAL